METYFNWLSEEAEEAIVDPLASNYTAMISAIIQQTPDPRIYEPPDIPE